MIRFSLRKAGERAKLLKCEVYSIGVDSWAADCGLLGYAAEKIELKEFAPHITSESAAAKLQYEKYEKIESFFLKGTAAN